MMSKKIDLIVALLTVAIFIESPLCAQSPALIEAGKKEGKVVIYGSLENDTTDAIKEAFQNKTGIEAEYWRASATKVMDRALTEYRTGKAQFDIILTNDNPTEIMFR